jgi:hypothetical protein
MPARGTASYPSTYTKPVVRFFYFVLLTHSIVTSVPDEGDIDTVREIEYLLQRARKSWMGDHFLLFGIAAAVSQVVGLRF